MTAFVFSDTHGQYHDMLRLCQKFRPDRIMHLGDLASDARVLSSVAPVIAVRGNCDGFNTDYPEERTGELEGVKILLLHGHTVGVKHSLDPLKRKAKDLGVDLTLFGHTHIPYNAGRLFNPGSLRHSGTFGKLVLHAGMYTAEVVNIKYS